MPLAALSGTEMIGVTDEGHIKRGGLWTGLADDGVTDDWRCVRSVLQMMIMGAP